MIEAVAIFGYVALGAITVALMFSRSYRTQVWDLVLRCWRLVMIVWVLTVVAAFVWARWGS